ncbi:MAG: hypothetical protein ACRDIY_06930 [Chloroflexota bacterium]
MRLLIDADGLIKVHRAGILGDVLRVFSCAVPGPVFHEVVTRGKAYLHQDAEEIEVLLAGSAEIVPVHARTLPESGLGSGELAVLDLVSRDRDSVVMSDDRRFLSALATEGIPFLTPTDVLVIMARRRDLAPDQARDALERLRPAIREAAYWEARQNLENGAENREG